MKNLILIAAMILLTSCASTSIKHVSKEKFEGLIANSRISHSAHTYKMIGDSKTRLYLEHWNLLTGKTIVYWTELANWKKPKE